MKDVIVVQGITKDYGNGKGVFDVSFVVKEGEVFGYLGPNGAGKSTTIRQLMGFIKPQMGECTILDCDCFKLAQKVQEDTGYLAGEIAFMEDMTGEGYLKFIAELKGIADDTRMKELLTRFELNPKGRIRKMSKGMKQKIGIVAAFMGSPKVVILDEPTSGLDPLMQNRFVELILEEKKKGTTILMSSHIFEEVEKTCDRTAIIRDGKIVDVIDMSRLHKLKKKIYTVTFQNSEMATQFADEVVSDRIDIKGNQVSFYIKEDLPLLLRSIAAYEPIDLSIATQSLEELFMHYYGEESGCD